MSFYIYNIILKIKALNAKLSQKLKMPYCIFEDAIKKFREDHCTIHANAIAYAIAISIIPLLTIFVQLAKVNRNIVQNNIASFLAAYGLSDTSELLIILDDILSRSETIAGLGFLFVLYAATNFFRSLEDAFNYIYQVQKKRPLLYRFSLYISIFILLPIIGIFAGQSIQSLRYYFQPPEIRKTILRNKQSFVATSDGTIRIYKKDQLQTKIDLKINAPLKAPYRNILIDLKTGRTGHPWEVTEKHDMRQEPNNHDRYDIIDITQNAKTIFVISSGASLFYSKDNGKTWQYQQILFYTNVNVYIPRIKDMHINKNGELLMLVNDVAYSGIITRTSEKKWAYKRIEKIYNKIIEIKNINANITRSFKNGIYLPGKGSYLYSNTEGRTWEGPFDALYGRRKLQITAMQANNAGDMYFSAKNGAFWIKKPFEVVFPDIRANVKQDIKDFFIDPDGRGILFGSQGLFRYTKDNGYTWHILKDKAVYESDFLSYMKVPQAKEKKLYFSGKENTLIVAQFPKLLKELDTMGQAIATSEYKVLSNTSFWRSLLFKMLLEPLLLITVFLITVMLYILLPNTKVYYRAAIIGASVSALSLIAFLSGFRIWISNFTSTEFIYGVWAAIPLAMLIILFSTYILLFGLELAYVTQEKYLKKL